MSTLANLLARTRAAADQRSAANAEQYAKLVRKCAEGAEVSPEEVLRQLDKLDRDPSEFAAAVEEAAKRLEVAAVAADLGNRQKAANVAVAKAAGIESEWRTANTAVDQRFRPMLDAAIAEKAAAERAVEQARHAVDTLRNSAPAELQENLRRAQNKRGAVASKLAKASNDLRDAESRVYDRERIITRANSPTTSPLERQRMQPLVWKAEQELAEWRGIVAEVKASFQSLTDEMAAVDAEFAAAERALTAV